MLVKNPVKNIAQVTFVKGFEDVKITYPNKVTGENNSLLCGDCNNHTKEIRISLKENRTQKDLESTLFHELIHFSLYKTGWSQMLEEKELSEEALVLMLENHFAHLIQFK